MYRHLRPRTLRGTLGRFFIIHIHPRVLTLPSIFFLLDIELPFLRKIIEVRETVPRFLNRWGDVNRRTRKPQHLVRLRVPVEVFRCSENVSTPSCHNCTRTIVETVPVSGGNFSKMTFCDPTTLRPPTVPNIDRSSFAFPPWDDTVLCGCPAREG